MSLNIDPMQLLYLPNECLALIRAYLPLESQGRLSSVCKGLHSFMQDECFWKIHARENFPYMSKLEERSWFNHCSMNNFGARISKIVVSNGKIYSAWGKAICQWEKKSPHADKFLRLSTLTDHKAAINCFELRSLGLVKLMITGSSDKTCAVWSKDKNSGNITRKQTLEEHTEPVTVIRGCGENFITADRGGTICFWKFHKECSSYKLEGKKRIHTTAITCLQTIDKPPAAPILISGSKDGTLAFWKVNEDGITEPFQIIEKAHAGPITAVAGCLEDKILSIFTGSSKEKTLRVWRLVFNQYKNFSFQLRESLDAHPGGITDIFATSYSDKFYSTGKDKQIKGWNRVESEKKWEVKEAFPVFAKEPTTSLHVTVNPTSKKTDQIYYLASSKLYSISVENLNTFIPVPHPGTAEVSIFSLSDKHLFR